MKLTSNKSITIKSTGSYNLDSGPDFLNGEIIVENVNWYGNIEIHVKSSDWNLHKHQFDPSYDNVILHVVFQHDKDIFIGDRLLPTLELKNFIQEEHYQKYLNKLILKSEFVCSGFLNELDTIYLESMKEKAIIQRLNRKINLFLKLDDTEINFSQILYEMLGQAFGMKINTIPFQELTKRIPLKILKRERAEYSNSIILGVSGFFNVLGSENNSDWEFLKEKYLLHPMPIHVWKRKGLRPAGFPIQRLTQFAEVIKKFDFNTTFTKLTPEMMIKHFYEILDISFLNKIGEQNKLEISNSIKNLIILNCFVPFIWWFGKMKNDELLYEKAVDVLLLMQPEKNRITEKWSKLDIEIKKGYDSQALLEIYNEFCYRKKCLSCVIGNKILKG